VCLSRETRLTRETPVCLSLTQHRGLSGLAAERARGAALSAALPLESRDNAECMHARATHCTHTTEETHTTPLPVSAQSERETPQAT